MRRDEQGAESHAPSGASRARLRELHLEAASGGADAFAEKYFRHVLVALSAVAFVLRLIILDDSVASNPFAGAPAVDGETYWKWAHQIAAGRWIGETPFFSSPLYPYVLGVLARLGGQVSAVYEFQLATHIGTAVLLAWIIRRRFGAMTALVAAGFFYSLAEPVTYANRVLASTTQLLLLCVFWWSVDRAQARQTIGAWCLAGAACGVVCLSYPPAMLGLVLLGPWIYVQSAGISRRVLMAVVPVLAGAMVISPATFHNYKVTGELIPLTAHSGITFLQGNSPGARGVFTEVPGLTNSREVMHFDAAEMFRRETGRDGSWREIDRHLRNRGLAYLRENPGRAIVLELQKLILFLTGRHYDDIIPVAYERESGLVHYAHLAPLPTPWIMGAALIGLAPLLRRARAFAPELVMFALPLLVVLVFWYSPRYRFPAVPVLCLGAALTLAGATRWRTDRWAVVRLLAAVAIALMGEGLRGMTQLDRNAGPDVQFSLKLAGSYGRLNRMDEAIEVIERARVRYPDDAVVRSMHGVLLARSGERDAAIEAYDGALELDPASRAAKTGLAMLLIGRNEKGDPEAAIDHLRSSLGNALSDPLCHFGIGAALDKLGRTDEAAEAYRRALEANPGYAPALRAVESIATASDETEP